MKKSRISVMALLVMLFAAGSAFKAKTDMDARSAKEVSYYWFKTGTTTTYQGFRTQSSEQPMSGCSGTGHDCEKGYDQNQLINPAQPSQGVKSTEVSNQKSLIVKS